MNNLDNASSQHILISYSEYERLKNIEEEFQKMQKQVHKKLLIPSKYNKKIFIHCRYCWCFILILYLSFY
jgi:hypothetical protein